MSDATDRIFGSLPPRRAREQEVVEVERLVPAPLLYDTEIDGYWVGKFGITSIGMIVREDATEREWYDACDATAKVLKSKDWTKADLCLFGLEMLNKTVEQIAGVVGVSAGSVESYASVSRAANDEVRMVAPSVAHFRVVMSLKRDFQIQWLQRARSEGWSVTTLKEALGVVKKPSRKTAKTLTKDLRKAVNRLSAAERAGMIANLRQLADELDS